MLKINDQKVDYFCKQYGCVLVSGNDNDQANNTLFLEIDAAIFKQNDFYLIKHFHQHTDSEVIWTTNNSQFKLINNV